MSGGCGEEEAVPKSGKWGRAIPESGELYLGKTDGAESYLEVEVEILMHLVLKVSVNLKKQEAVVVQGDRFPVFFGSYRYWVNPLEKWWCHLIWESVIGLIKILEI